MDERETRSAAGQPEDAELEVLEGEIVRFEDLAPASAREREQLPVHAPVLPAMQAAAMAATGFLAGATAMALVKRWGAARRLLEAPLPERPLERWPVGTTRTYLVSVRLISRSDG